MFNNSTGVLIIVHVYIFILHWIVYCTVLYFSTGVLIIVQVYMFYSALDCVLYCIIVQV